MPDNNTDRAARKVVTGRVVSDKMDKTIVVVVERQMRHRLYGKVITTRKKYKVHDEKKEFKVGDRVIFEECRPLSKEKRWRVIGIDTSSPWNPRSDTPGWSYRVCRGCDLHYQTQQPRCPRCHNDAANREYPAYTFGGFLARRDEQPVLADG